MLLKNYNSFLNEATYTINDIPKYFIRSVGTEFYDYSNEYLLFSNRTRVHINDFINNLNNGIITNIEGVTENVPIKGRLSRSMFFIFNGIEFEKINKLKRVIYTFKSLSKNNFKILNRINGEREFIKFKLPRLFNALFLYNSIKILMELNSDNHEIYNMLNNYLVIYEESNDIYTTFIYLTNERFQKILYDFVDENVHNTILNDDLKNLIEYGVNYDLWYLNHKNINIKFDFDNLVKYVSNLLFSIFEKFQYIISYREIYNQVKINLKSAMQYDISLFKNENEWLLIDKKINIPPKTKLLIIDDNNHIVKKLQFYLDKITNKNVEIVYGDENYFMKNA